jgi:hypothetical protein
MAGFEVITYGRFWVIAEDMANGEMKKHLEQCDKCVETAPHQWDLCEEGQRILRESPDAEHDL